MTQAQRALLVYEASRWVGVKEVGGNNQGELVRMFQKAVDNKASGEAWCMAFVQYCVRQCEAAMLALGIPVKNALFGSEHCLTVWNHMPDQHKMNKPEVGSIVIWRHTPTTNGHTGIVSKIVNATTFESIEGNTRDSKGIVREGDGVLLQTRTTTGAGAMKVVGYLRPWL